MKKLEKIQQKSKNIELLLNNNHLEYKINLDKNRDANLKSPLSGTVHNGDNESKILKITKLNKDNKGPRQSNANDAN